MKSITRQDMVREWGNPCILYAEGCVICEAWEFWETMTDEKIEYEGHDVEVCNCRTCSLTQELEQGVFL